MNWIAPTEKDISNAASKKRLRVFNRALSLLAAGVLLFARTCFAGGFTTLTLNNVPANGPVVLTNSVTIGSNQVAQIVAYSQLNSYASIFLEVEKQGITYAFTPGDYNWRDITPVAGPVTIRLRAETNYLYQPLVNAYCTVRVTPEAFSPEKTVMVAPGSGGANVSLECSTNLTEWSAATNGVYGSLNTARFFRINLNRSGFVPPMPPDGSVASQVDAQTTTLFVRHPMRPNDELSINEYQTAELVAVGPKRAHLELWRGSMRLSLTGINTNENPIYSSWKDWSPLRGPATFKLSSFVPNFSSPGDGYCTIRVFTEQYPPDKTLITLPGTNSYAVTLEGSTDLVNWSSATNGAYTVPKAMFFRIRSDVLPPN